MFSDTKDGDIPVPYEEWHPTTYPYPAEGNRSASLSEGRYEDTAGWHTRAISDIEAYFVHISFAIDTSRSPRRGGTVSGSGTYYEGDTCTLTATPNSGYKFDYWERAADGAIRTSDSFSFEVTQYEFWTAHFSLDDDSSDESSEEPPEYFTVSTNVAPPNSGTVTGGGQYEENTQCTLTATAARGYYFSIWKSSTGQTSSANPMTFYVTADITWTAMFGTHRLIYFDRSGSGIDVPGDATVTVDFDPKKWTCEAYGQDHDVSLTVAPSWAAASTITAQGEFPLPHATITIAGGSTFTIGLTANTHCSAGIYPEITAIVVIQQMNVGTFTLEVPLTVGTQSTATITASGGSITALN